MARFLIGTLPVVGHINPILSIARELVSRGHVVHWYTGEQFRLKVESSGATWRPMKRTSTYGAQGMEAYPERQALKGVERVKWDIEKVFIPAAAGQADDLAEILQDFPADAILADTMFLGARFASERLGGPPWAVYNFTVFANPLATGDTAPVGLGLPPAENIIAKTRNRGLHWLADNVLFKQIHQSYRDARVAYGLPEGPATMLEGVMSPYLWLQGTTPSFEYPQSEMPPQVHFIGAVLPDPAPTFAVPSWWPEVEYKARPIVLLAQGTVAIDMDDLIKPALRALANEPVLVVATTSGSDLGMDIPDNARVASFIPYDRLMPHVDVLVTNGSYGTVHFGLTNGVPIVASGVTEDKSEVCERVAWSGAGIRVKGDPPKEEHIRQAVRLILKEPSFRNEARRLERDMRTHDGPKEAATLLEELARTGKPVTTPLKPMGSTAD